jgi:hypothetical protein
MAQVSNQSIQPVYPRRLAQPPRRERTPVLVRCGTRIDAALPLRPATIVDKESEN